MADKTCLKTTGTIILLLVLVVTSAAVQADTIYVDVDASGDDDGTSWTDAYNYLQDALIDDAGSGDEIWVAEGTYYPDEGDTPTDDDRTETFQLVDGAEVYGGFGGYNDGEETARSQRDWEDHETILSGDIDQDAGPGPDADDSYHVVTGADNATIDGFTITGGYANGSGDNCYGAGMFNYEVSPTVKNCSFIYNDCLSVNYSCGGGGIYNGYSNATITGCTFYNNRVAKVWPPNPAYIGLGAAMLNAGDPAPTITNCVFSTNYANTMGGAIDNASCDPIIKNCVFVMNDASWYGGGISNSSSEPIITNSTFTGNSANSGGGMSNWSSIPIITNSTIIGNAAHTGGGMFNRSNSDTKVTNCIFWGNTASVDGGEIYNLDDASDPCFTYCDIDGGINGTKCYGYDSIAGGGNILTDPAFINIFDFSDITVAAAVGSGTYIKVEDASLYTVGDEIEYDNDGTLREVTAVDEDNDKVTFVNDPLGSSSAADKVIYNWGNGATDADEDLHLDSDSPCIGEGHPSFDYDGQTDIDGQPRVMVEEVDIGADEAAYMPTCHPDYDDWVNVDKPVCWCYQRQCHGDADGLKEGGEKAGYWYVGLEDLNILTAAWLVKEPPDGPGIGSVENGICADFGHNLEGNAKSGYWRVGTDDLNILVEYWKVLEPPDGNGVDPNCLECE